MTTFLPFVEFLRFIQVSDQTLACLLELLGLSSTNEAMERVRGYFREFTDEDLYTLDWKKSIRGRTWQQLCGPIQSGQENLQIPAHLYEAYCQDWSRRIKANCESPFTEEELIFGLTGAYVKLSEFFLLEGEKGFIWSWDDERKGTNIQIIEETILHRCCYEYLKKKGYCYRSVEEYLRERANRPADPPCVAWRSTR